jgi:hypothetical protein
MWHFVQYWMWLWQSESNIPWHILLRVDCQALAPQSSHTPLFRIQSYSSRLLLSHYTLLYYCSSELYTLTYLSDQHRHVLTLVSYPLLMASNSPCTRPTPNRSSSMPLSNHVEVDAFGESAANTRPHGCLEGATRVNCSGRSLFCYLSAVIPQITRLSDAMADVAEWCQYRYTKIKMHNLKSVWLTFVSKSYAATYFTLQKQRECASELCMPHHHINRILTVHKAGMASTERSTWSKVSVKLIAVYWDSFVIAIDLHVATNSEHNSITIHVDFSVNISKWQAQQGDGVALIMWVYSWSLAQTWSRPEYMLKTEACHGKYKQCHSHALSASIARLHVPIFVCLIVWPTWSSSGVPKRAAFHNLHDAMNHPLLWTIGDQLIRPRPHPTFHL